MGKTCNVSAAVAFYAAAFDGRILDLEAWQQGQAAYPAVLVGDWRINIHPLSGPGLTPRAKRVVPGSLDVCVNTTDPMAMILARLASKNIEIVWGPVAQAGARGSGLSVYFRDLDGNLVEVLSYAGT